MNETSIKFSNIKNSCLQVDRNRSLKDKKLSDIKQGVVVNHCIKGEGCYSITSNQSLPEELYKKDKQQSSGKFLKNPITTLAAVSLVTLGTMAFLASFYKKSLIAKKATPSNNSLPPIGRMISINDDNVLVLYLLNQDPSQRSLLAATGVIAASSIGCILKNFVDGAKEIWVKKQEADIKRDQEEALIDIETRSFAGKNQILSHLLTETQDRLDNFDKLLTFKGVHSDPTFSFIKKPSFKSNEKPKENKNNIAVLLLGIATIGAMAFFTHSIFKNIKTVAQQMLESTYNKFKDDISKLGKDELAKKLKKDAHYFNDLSQSQKEEILSGTKLNKEEIKDFIKEVYESNFETPHAAVSGRGNKTGFSSFVQDMTGFLYTYIVNPTPQTRNLFMLLTSASMFTYLGRTVVEATKEVKVKKENAKTEVNLHDRLVQVELQNFMAKKKSFIDPLIAKYRNFITQQPSNDAKDLMKSTILEEVKNGPPFIYS